jgi:hypothetical protein
MTNSKLLVVIVAALVLLAGACGKESGDTLLTVDTVPPAPPVGLEIQAENDLVTVRWDENAEPDLEGYRLYRSSEKDGPYKTATSNLLYCPWYYGQVLPMEMTYFKVTAVDRSGNESAYSRIVGIYNNTDRKRQPDNPIE